MGAAQALPHRVNRLTGTDATAGKGRERGGLGSRTQPPSPKKPIFIAEALCVGRKLRWKSTNI